MPGGMAAPLVVGYLISLLVDDVTPGLGYSQAGSTKPRSSENRYGRVPKAKDPRTGCGVQGMERNALQAISLGD